VISHADIQLFERAVHVTCHASSNSLSPRSPWPSALSLYDWQILSHNEHISDHMVVGTSRACSRKGYKLCDKDILAIWQIVLVYAMRKK